MIEILRVHFFFQMEGKKKKNRKKQTSFFFFIFKALFLSFDFFVLVFLTLSQMYPLAFGVMLPLATPNLLVIDAESLWRSKFASFFFVVVFFAPKETLFKCLAKRKQQKLGLFFSPLGLFYLFC